jgi:hypothetical protein
MDINTITGIILKNQYESTEMLAPGCWNLFMKNYYITG